MKYETIAIFAFCAIAFGGLGYLFVSLTDGINKPAASAASRLVSETVVQEPPAGPIVDEEAPIVIGSPSVTTNAARDEVKVNFNECAVGNGTLETQSGAIVIAVQGIDGNDCVISYSAGDNNVTCRVPSNLGVQRFSFTNDAPDLGTIKRYCQPV
jgi:hypothetical protein